MFFREFAGLDLDRLPVILESDQGFLHIVNFEDSVDSDTVALRFQPARSTDDLDDFPRRIALHKLGYCAIAGQ